MSNTTKVSAKKWVETAKNMLISEGLSAVKIDRLAKKLGVTRGGFYHHFKNYKDLLAHLLDEWARSNDFIPEITNIATPVDALRKLEKLVDRLIAETDFSPAFEMAVREWARIDPKVRSIVDKINDDRIRRLTILFSALGCDDEEAPVRARVFYFHQIGYYSLGYHKQQSKEERIKSTPVYLRILCGRRYLEAAETQAQKWL